MANAKKTVSVRLDGWLSDEVDRLAAAHGVSSSALIRQFIHQGANNQNALAEYLTNESEKVAETMRRIEAVVCGHLYASVVKEKADRPKFMAVVEQGMKVAAQLEQKAAALETEGT